MKEIKFVNAEDLNTIEDYTTSLLTGATSLRTLLAYHLRASDKGILKEDEIKLVEIIKVSIANLLTLYQTQLDNMTDRSDLNQDAVIEAFRATLPNVKIPRKRKNVKRKEDEVLNLP